MSESLPDLRDVKSRLQEASTYLRIEEILDRKIELEDLVAQPGFWDDAKGAKKLSQELAEISEDITVYQNLMIKMFIPVNPGLSVEFYVFRGIH